MSVFESIFEASPDGLIVVSSAGRILYANGTAEQMFGYAPGALPGQFIEALVPSVAAAEHVRHREHYGRSPNPRPMGATSKLQGRRRDDSLFPVDVMLSPLAAGDQPDILCVVRDASARREAEASLHIANTVFQTTQEAIVVTDVHGVIVAVNPAFERVTEYPEREALGKHMRILRSGKHDAIFYRQMWHAILTTGEWQGAIWNRRRGGEIYQEWLSISTVHDHEGRPFQYVGISADMTRMKHAETPTERLAHYDALTGLPNRLLFDSRVRKTWERAHRDQQQFAVLFLDLDGFKSINDCYGHDVGDELLKQVTCRLSESLRETDTIARLGGDEFIIVLEDVCRRDVERIAQLLIDRISQGFDLGQPQPVSVGLSLGWSLFPEHAHDIGTLIRLADQALYQAKRTGRGKWLEHGCGKADDC